MFYERTQKGIVKKIKSCILCFVGFISSYEMKEDRILKTFKLFYNKYRHIVPMLLYGVFYLASFTLLEKTVTRHYHVVHLSIDEHIPFLEVFIIPYLLWFAYIAVAIVYFALKDKEDYIKLCAFLATGMTIFLIVSALWPNGHHLRLLAVQRDNIFTHMIGALWQTDTPTNIVPSIHVYNSIGAHLAIAQSKHFENRKGIKLASLVLCVSIILSTVFIKQHSVFDMITAFIMAVAMYLLVYRTEVLATARTKLHSIMHKKPQVN